MSVIIRARDGAEELRRCLQALRGQEGVGEVETIYVDTGSVDGSHQVVAETGVESIWIPREAGFSFGAGWPGPSRRWPTRAWRAPAAMSTVPTESD